MRDKPPLPRARYSVNVWSHSTGFSWRVYDHRYNRAAKTGRCTSWLAAYKSAWRSLRELEAQG